MRTRLLLLLLAVLLLGAASGGVWVFTHRAVDPVAHAAMRASLGDLRETLLLNRNAIAREPDSPTARMQLAQTLLKIYDGVAAEKGFRAAEEKGADHWAALEGIGQAESLQSHWQAVLDDLPGKGPSPTITAKLLLLRGTAQIALNQIAAATATLADARQAAPDQVATMLLAARLSLATRDVVAAEAEVDAALRVDPKQPEALLLKLAIATAHNDQPAAMAIAGRAIDAAPWSIAPRLDRANLLMLSGDDAKAQADVDTLLSRFSNLPAALYLNAVLLARSGRNAEAALALERLGPMVDMFPRMLYIHARVAMALGRTETALDLATRYNTRFPNDRDGILLLAQLQMAANHANLAIALLEKATGVSEGNTQTGQSDDATIMALLGNAYAAVGNNAAAFRVRQKAASLAPDNARVLTGLGLSQLRQGETSAAINTLEHSAELAPPPPNVSDGLFTAALSVGDFSRAEAALTRRRAQEGESETVGSMSALLLLARGDSDGALKAFQTLHEKFPEATVPKVNLAKLLYVKGNQVEAEKLLQDVLAKNPADELALTTQIQIWIKDKNFAAARQALETAEAAAPDDLRLVATHADLLMRSGDPRAALALLEARRKLGKLPTPLLGILADAQAAAGMPDAALTTYQQALLAVPTDAQTRVKEVNLLLQQNRIKDAQDSLKEGLVQSPGTFGLMLAVVMLEARTSGTDAALKLADTLRAQPNNMPAAAFLRGDLLMQAREFDAAAKAYTVEYDKSPSHELVLRLANADASAGHPDAAAQVLRGWWKNHMDDPEVAGALGQLDTMASRWDDAQTDFEARLLHRPNDPIALNNLAWIYQEKKDPRARDMAQRAYKLDPKPQSADTLGWIMLQQGETEPAIALLKQAVAELPADGGLTYHLAVALQKSGKTEDSVKLLEPILAQSSTFPERPAAEQLLRELKPAR